MGILKRDRRDDIDIESCLANLHRLSAVRASGLLDGHDRARLDDLTQAASDQLAAPMAFMSIVDEDRIVFAGASGISGELAETRQNTPGASYCPYVAASDDVLVVSDSLTDPVFAHHPATTDAGVRAYLGVPLRHADQCIGSFCVVDTKPRAWTDDDLANLQRLAADAMAGIPGAGST